MTIDFFTIIAQIFNFVVLIMLLRHFLYGPIVRTMDAREHHITTELDEAELKNAEARQEAAELKRERQELEDRRGEFLSQAQADAEKWRNDLLVQARDEVEERRAGWQDAIEREKTGFLANLKQRAGEQIYEIAQRVLGDLANLDLERHIIDSFIYRLETMDDSGLDTVAARLARWQKMKPEEIEATVLEREAVISTAFEIDAETKGRIAAAVTKRLGQNVGLRFEETPELICGIELKTQGYKAAWSLQNYLETLEENLSLAFMSREAEPGQGTEAEPAPGKETEPRA